MLRVADVLLEVEAVSVSSAVAETVTLRVIASETVERVRVRGAAREMVCVTVSGDNDDEAVNERDTDLEKSGEAERVWERVSVLLAVCVGGGVRVGVAETETSSEFVIEAV
jgi:hypothetical protein